MVYWTVSCEILIPISDHSSTRYQYKWSAVEDVNGLVPKTDEASDISIRKTENQFIYILLTIATISVTFCLLHSCAECA